MQAEKLDHIDALRGAAIIGVIAVHVSQSIPGLSPLLSHLAGFGQYGVQLFFVVSAYTLTKSWHSRGGETRRVGKFYVRRVFRIAPLYWTAIALYLLGSLAFYRVRAFEPTSDYTARTVLTNLLFVHGLDPRSINSVVPGGWSIGTEMAFYAIFPAVISVWSGLGSGRKQIIAAIIACAALWAFQALLSLFIEQGFGLNDFFYYSIITQFPVFVVGIVLYTFDDGSEVAWYDYAWFVALIVITFGLYVWAPDETYVVSPVLAGLSFCFLFRIVRSTPFIAKALKGIGTLSFSMYVFHFIFAWYGLRAITSALGLAGDWVYAPALAATIALTWLIANVTKVAIEDPGIALGRKVINWADRLLPRSRSIEKV